MENLILKRKQVLKNTLIDFVKNNTTNDVYQVQTDINKVYFIYKNQILDGNCFNLKASRKIKNTELSKNTVYYITTISEPQRKLFNI